MRKIIKQTFALLLLVTLFVTYIPVNSQTAPPILTARNLTMIPQEEYDINIKNKISNSTYQWKSSNNNVVKVNRKNGKIKALKNGKSIVSCRIKTKNKTYTLKCNVTVADKAPFFQNNLMAHALGGLDNKHTYSNALEGLQQSLKNDYGFIEVDLILTSDNKLVCSHGWSEQTYKDTGVFMDMDNLVMTYDKFMDTKIQGKYTTIDVSTIVSTMKEYKNLLVELDLRTLDKKAATQTAKAIKKAFGTDKSITDRLLVQVGSPEMHQAIDDIYHFKYYQYFIHKAEAKDSNINSVIRYCKDNGIVSVAIKDTYITKKNLTKLKANGLYILSYTIDDLDIANELLDNGVSTICTNFITPSDMN